MHSSMFRSTNYCRTGKTCRIGDAWPSPPSSSFPSEKTIFVIHPCPIAQNHTSAMQKKPMKGFHTLCLHSGQTPESNRGHLTPIYATSTYTFETAEQSE